MAVRLRHQFGNKEARVARALLLGRQLAVFRVQVLAEDGKLMADGTVDMFCTGDAAHE